MIFDREEYIKQVSPIEKELKILFQNNRSPIFFEIGACEGEDSVKYSRLFPKATIYAFEPLSGNFEMMKKTFKRYGTTNVTPVNLALSDNSGEAEFFVSSSKKPTNVTDWEYGNKSSSLLPPEKHIEIIDFIEFKNRVRVKTTTLQSFCTENKIKGIDFIHMDVQGAELMVLRGAGSYLNTVRAIWLEVSKIELYKEQPLADEVFKFMDANGFDLVKSTVDDITGEQLYVNKLYYSAPVRFFLRFSSKERHFFGSKFKRVRRMIKLIFSFFQKRPL